jgi:hypothetical protein
MKLPTKMPPDENKPTGMALAAVNALVWSVMLFLVCYSIYRFYQLSQP